VVVGFRTKVLGGTIVSEPEHFPVTAPAGREASLPPVKIEKTEKEKESDGAASSWTKDTLQKMREEAHSHWNHGLFRTLAVENSEASSPK
jgi:hypothetical protein